MKTNEIFAKTGIYPMKQMLLRGMALLIASVAALSALAQPQAAAKGAEQGLPVVEVYKSAQCGCCKLWAEHLQRNGFKVVLHDVDDVPAARKMLGMPDQYGSCHTARAGQYLIEGHVPAADIKRLLKERPQVGGHGAIGLAVPAMPPGSPGMESDDPVPYETLLIGKDGKARVYARH
jgi:hypothetical protein